jgi:ABC-type oligopeptide transport system ATPase subunit
MIIVKCDDVKKHFSGRTGVMKAVDGVSLEIGRGEAFGLVGESGCGKTTLGKIILGIIKPDSGQVLLGTKKIQVIFQDPYNSLDPKMKVGDIIEEGLLIRRSYFVSRRSFDEKREVEDILELVRLPKDALKKYPHQFSGGERQRIAIGRAVLTKPEFIVCDEPVSNLDVTIQLEILTLLKGIRERLGITYLFISHDLKVVRFICDRVAVMRHGRILEAGTVNDIYTAPSNSYTKNLLRAAFYDTIKF